jgi:hypothetical protein
MCNIPWCRRLSCCHLWIIVPTTSETLATCGQGYKSIHSPRVFITGEKHTAYSWSIKFLSVGSLYSQYTVPLMRGVNNNKSSQLYTYISKLGKLVFNTFIHAIHMSNEHAFQTVLIIKLLRRFRKASHEKNYATVCFLNYKQEWMAGIKHYPFQHHSRHHDCDCNRKAQCIITLETHAYMF